MGSIQRRALASPPERWVSFRAGHWKGFVFGKGLRTSGDWSGKHPFKASESLRGGTRLLGYCLPLLCMAGTEGKGWVRKAFWEKLFWLSFLLPHLEVGPLSKHSSVVFTFLGLLLNDHMTLRMAPRNTLNLLLAQSYSHGG